MVCAWEGDPPKLGRGIFRERSSSSPGRYLPLMGVSSWIQPIVYSLSPTTHTCKTYAHLSPLSSYFSDDAFLFLTLCKWLPFLHPGQDLHYCFITVYNSSDNCWGPGHTPYTVFKLFPKCHILLGVDLARDAVVSTLKFETDL